MSDINGDLLETKAGAPTVKLNKHGKPRAGGPRKRYKKKKGGAPCASEEASTAADEHIRHDDTNPSQEESCDDGVATILKGPAESQNAPLLEAAPALAHATTTKNNPSCSTPSQEVVLPATSTSSLKTSSPSLNPTAPSFVPPVAPQHFGSVAEEWREAFEQGSQGSSFLNGPVDFDAFNEPAQDSFWMRLAAAGDFLGHGESSADPVDESQSVLEEYLREVEGFSAEHFGQDLDPFGFGPFDDLDGDLRSGGDNSGTSSNPSSAYWPKHAFGGGLDLPPSVEHSSADATAGAVRGRPRGRSHSNGSSGAAVMAWSDRSGGNGSGAFTSTGGIGQPGSRGEKLRSLMPVVGDDGLPPRPSPVERFTSSSSSHSAASLSSSPGHTGAAAMEAQAEALERAKWRRWVVDAAEAERQRRMLRLAALQEEEDAERDARRAWAAAAIEAEHRVRVSEQFLAAMTNSLWFTNRFVACSAATFEKYEIVCPYAHAGCAVVCPRRDLEEHLRVCAYAHGVARREREAMSSGPYSNGGGGGGGNVKSTSAGSGGKRNNNSYSNDVNGRGHSGSASSAAPGEEDATSEDSQVWDYEVVCPNAVMGCRHVCMRLDLSPHLLTCSFGGGGTAHQADAERARWRKVVQGQMEEERLRRVVENQRREYAYAAAAFAARTAEANIERSTTTATAAYEEQTSPSSPRLTRDHRPQEKDEIQKEERQESESSPRVHPLPETTAPPSSPSSPRHRSLSPPSGARARNAHADATSWLPAQDRLVAQTTAPRRRGSTAEVFAEGHLHRSARAAATQAGAAAAAAAAARRPRYPSDAMGSGRRARRSNSSRSEEGGNRSNRNRSNAQESESNGSGDNGSTVAAGIAALSDEIAAMAAAAEAATVARRSSYELILAQVQGVVGRLWSDGRVTPYGSFATGLMGEKGSDLDIVVCWDESGSRNGDKDEESDSIQGRYQAPAYSVQRLAAALRRERRWVRVAKVLDRGKLPIIKAEARVDVPSSKSGSSKDSAAANADDQWPPGCTTVALDISMFVPGHTGLVSTAFVKELVAQLPPLRPLCLVTKQLLKAHGLGDPYTGGVSAYAVVLMATFFLFQRHQERLARAHALALCARAAAHTAEVAAAHSKHKAAAAAVATSPEDAVPPPPPLPLLMPVSSSTTAPGLPGVPRRLKIPTANQNRGSSSPSATDVTGLTPPPVSPRTLARQQKTTIYSTAAAPATEKPAAKTPKVAVYSNEPSAQTSAVTNDEVKMKAKEGKSAAEKKHSGAYAGAWRSGASAALVGDRARSPPPPVHTYVPYTSTSTATTVTSKGTAKGAKNTMPALPRRLMKQRDVTTAMTGLADSTGTEPKNVSDVASATSSADIVDITGDNNCMSPADNTYLAANGIAGLEDEKLPSSYAARVAQGHALSGTLTRPDRSWLKRQSSSPKQRKRSSSSPQSRRNSTSTSNINVNSGINSTSSVSGKNVTTNSISSSDVGNLHPSSLSPSTTNSSNGPATGLGAHSSSNDGLLSATTTTTTNSASKAVADPAAAPTVASHAVLSMPSSSISQSTVDHIAQPRQPASSSSTTGSHPDAFAFLGRHKARVALLYGQKLPLPHAAAAVLTPPKTTRAMSRNSTPTPNKKLREDVDNAGSSDAINGSLDISEQRSFATTQSLGWCRMSFLELQTDDLDVDKSLINTDGQLEITSEISSAITPLAPSFSASESASAATRNNIAREEKIESEAKGNKDEEGTWVTVLPKWRNSLKSPQHGETNSPMRDGDTSPKMRPKEDTSTSAAAVAAPAMAHTTVPASSSSSSIFMEDSSQSTVAASGPAIVPAASELEPNASNSTGPAAINPPTTPAVSSSASSSLLLSQLTSTQQPPPPQRRRSSPHLQPGLSFDDDGSGMDEDSLGAMLLDFWQFWGVEFKAGLEGFSVRRGGFRFGVKGAPRHPQASDPVVIEDPVNVISNVGRSSYHFVKVQKLFDVAHQTLAAAQAAANSRANRLADDNCQGPSLDLLPTGSLDSQEKSAAHAVLKASGTASSTEEAVSRPRRSHFGIDDGNPRNDKAGHLPHTPPSILSAVLVGNFLPPATPI